MSDEQLVACPYCDTPNDPKARVCVHCRCELPRAPSKVEGVMQILGNIGCIMLLLPVLAILLFVLYALIRS